MNKIFIEHLPRFKEGNQKNKIDWTSCDGYTINFIYRNNKVSNNKYIQGDFKISNYKKENQRISVEYKGNTIEVLTSDILNCKLSRILKKDIYNYKPDKNKDKWIDLTNIPLNGKGIDWRKVAANKQKIEFKYFNIIGYLTVVLYENRYITITYKNYKDTIYTSNLTKVQLGNLLKEELYRQNLDESTDRWVDLRYVSLNGNGIDWIESCNKKMTIRFKYDDIIDVIELIKYNVKNRMITLKYKGILVDMEVNSFARCDLGSILNKNNRRVITGLNDMATTHPEVAIYFVNKDDMCNYTHGTQKKLKVRCPDCGCEKEMTPSNLINHGFACNVCGDGISYPNKFMLNLLQQLDINFKAEKTFSWLSNKRYDFYIKKLNCIIEMHGEQHYKKSFYTMKKGRSIEEEKKNDEFKKEKAINNGVKHYISINCTKSYLDFIKNNIIKSGLSELLDLSKVDWNQCAEFAADNMIKIVCDIKRLNPEYSTRDIAKLTKLSYSTIINYLKFGNQLCWCEYSVEQSFKDRGQKMRGANHPNARKVVCLNTNEIFNTMSEIKNKYNMGISHIGQCCKDERRSSGIDLDTGEPLRWMYYEDWLKEGFA